MDTDQRHLMSPTHSSTLMPEKENGFQNNVLLYALPEGEISRMPMYMSVQHNPLEINVLVFICVK
jgi:hypothetical protein